MLFAAFYTLPEHPLREHQGGTIATGKSNPHSSKFHRLDHIGFRRPVESTIPIVIRREDVTALPTIFYSPLDKGAEAIYS